MKSTTDKAAVSTVQPGGLWNRLRLNLRALRLAICGRWLSAADYATDYNSLSSSYNSQWLIHLKPTTNEFHQLITEGLDELQLTNGIVELGCGSGHTTEYLHRTWPHIPLDAVDISVEMLALAKQAISQEGDSVHWYCQDMLDFLQARKSSSISAIVSSWAIGYSRPARIIQESARTLIPGGVLAVIVNRLETMPAVFETFCQIMRRHPQSLQKALWPRFPKGKEELTFQLIQSGFEVTIMKEGSIAVPPPDSHRLDWLLKTGVLAGFDQVLPLKKDGPVRTDFANALDSRCEGWEHRYIIFKAIKK